MVRTPEQGQPIKVCTDEEQEYPWVATRRHKEVLVLALSIPISPRNSWTTAD